MCIKYNLWRTCMWTSFGFFCAASLLIIMTGSLVTKPAIFTEVFKEGFCRVSSWKYRNDARTCIQISISLYSTNITHILQESSILYNSDREILYACCECSYQINSRQNTHQQQKYVESWAAMYAKVGEVFKCFYHPNKTHQAILHRRFSMSGGITSVVVPSIFIIIFAAFFITIFLGLRKNGEKLCCCTRQSLHPPVAAPGVAFAI